MPKCTNQQVPLNELNFCPIPDPDFSVVRLSRVDKQTGTETCSMSF